MKKHEQQQLVIEELQIANRGYQLTIQKQFNLITTLQAEVKQLKRKTEVWGKPVEKKNEPRAV